MGELTDRLRVDPEQVRNTGGQFRYDDPSELVRDLILLKRAIPEATLVACDNPVEQLWGYIAYWNVSSRQEVAVEAHIPVMTLKEWASHGPRRAVAELEPVMSSAQGRRDLAERIVRMAQNEAGLPTHILDPPPEVVEPEPRTRYERMLALADDDEPL